MRALRIAAALAAGALLPLVGVPSHAVGPSLSIDDLTVTEPLPSEWGKLAILTVRLSEPAPQTVFFSFSVEPGAGGNVVPTSGRTYVSAGQSTAAFSARLENNGRYDAEPPTYTATISDPAGADISDGTGTLTVLNTEPSGQGDSCQATVRRERSGGTTSSTGLANPEFTPCRDDAVRGSTWSAGTDDQQSTWTNEPGETGWKLSRAGTSQDSLSEGTFAAWVYAESAQSLAALSCTTTHQPVLKGWSSVGPFGIYAEEPFSHTPIVAIDNGVSENLEYTLPDGSTVGINRKIREPYQDANGATGETLTVQALVITAPTGDQKVYGESKVAYVGNPCEG